MAAAATGGEGGRIAIYYQNASSYTGFTTSTATGGANTGGGNAGAGTIGFFDTSQANNRLYVDKLFSIDPSTTATYNSMTLPSECVALSWAGLEDFISPRGRRGGGNVGIGFIDFQGLWEGRETALSFSSLSMNRHFHGLPRSA